MGNYGHPRDRGRPRRPPESRSGRHRRRGCAACAETHAFSTNEAMLTGESVPAEKSIAPGLQRMRRSQSVMTRVFMGTSVVTGTAMAEVVATGMHTELGRIANLLATVEDSATPLQQRLAQVSRTLMFMCLGIVALVAIAGHCAAGRGPFDVFLLVSLAVAAVPEGLPAIVTIALAVGSSAWPRATCWSQAARGRDAWMRHGHLHGQDRNAHDRRDGGARALGQDHAAPALCRRRVLHRGAWRRRPKPASAILRRSRSWGGRCAWHPRATSIERDVSPARTSIPSTRIGSACQSPGRRARCM